MKMIEIAKKMDNIYVHCNDPDFRVSHFGADKFIEYYAMWKLAVHVVAAALGGIYKELPADPREFRIIIRNLVVDRNIMDEQEKTFWQFLENCHEECVYLASTLREE